MQYWHFIDFQRGSVFATFSCGIIAVLGTLQCPPLLRALKRNIL